MEGERSSLLQRQLENSSDAFPHIALRPGLSYKWEVGTGLGARVRQQSTGVPETGSGARREGSWWDATAKPAPPGLRSQDRCPRWSECITAGCPSSMT